MLTAVRWMVGAIAVGVPFVLGTSDVGYTHAGWERPPAVAVFAPHPAGTAPIAQTTPSPAPEASRESLTARPTPSPAPAQPGQTPRSPARPGSPTPAASGAPKSSPEASGPPQSPSPATIPSPVPDPNAKPAQPPVSSDVAPGSVPVTADPAGGTPVTADPGTDPAPSDPAASVEPTAAPPPADPAAAAGSPPPPPSQNAAPQPTPPPPAPKPRSFDQLASDINSMSGGAAVSVTLIELGGNSPGSWSTNGDQQFTAASTYKLPLLMAEADGIANGRFGANDSLCYQDGDWEDGYFGDYAPGNCYTRIDLMTRTGQFSDNTSAHILVRYLGGPDALNAYAQAHGARESAFFDPNVTTSSDLARLLASESSGQAGGKGAQQILYPLLTHTHWESGAPAGVPGGATVVHKVGMIGSVDNDAALIVGGPNGLYILVVCTDGLGGDAGWALIAQINARVWAYEAVRW